MLELVDRTNLSFVDLYHKGSSPFSGRGMYLPLKVFFFNKIIDILVCILIYTYIASQFTLIAFSSIAINIKNLVKLSL